MNYAHESQKVLVTGASGSGKTTYFLSRIRDWRAFDGAKLKQLYVFDHEGEFSRKTGIRPAQTPRDFGGRVIAFDPSLMFRGRFAEAFAFFCDFAFEHSTRFDGAKLFCCDELQKFIGTSASEIPQELKNILETGRRYELDFMAISQAPNLIHNRVKNQLSEIVAFQLIEENAAKFVESFGFSTQMLLPGEFMRFKTKTGELFSGTVSLPGGEIREKLCSSTPKTGFKSTSPLNPLRSSSPIATSATFTPNRSRSRFNSTAKPTRKR